MALGDLLRAFERDTAAEAAAIRARGAADAARIADAAARDRDARLATSTAAFAAERRGAADRELAAATRAVRAEVLAARAAMLERIRAAVAAALPAHVGAHLIASALACAGDGDGVLRCPAALARAVPRMRIEIDPSVTGAVIELANGTRIDATLDALLAREWPRLACEALALVQGQARAQAQGPEPGQERGRP